MSDKNNHVEKRESKRNPLIVELKIGTKSPEHLAYMVNISSQGILLHSPQPFYKGNILNMKIVDESYKDLENVFSGEVVWAKTMENISHLGIKFTKSYQELINKYYK